MVETLPFCPYTLGRRAWMTNPLLLASAPPTDSMDTPERPQSGHGLWALGFRRKPSLREQCHLPIAVRTREESPERGEQTGRACRRRMAGFCGHNIPEGVSVLAFNKRSILPDDGIQCASKHSCWLQSQRRVPEER